MNFHTCFSDSEGSTISPIYDLLSCYRNRFLSSIPNHNVLQINLYRMKNLLLMSLNRVCNANINL